MPSSDLEICQSVAMASGDNTPLPGWYPDPNGAGHRWWDGSGWTKHLHTGDTDAVADPTTRAAAGPSGDRDGAPVAIEPSVLVTAGAGLVLFLSTFLSWINADGVGYHAYDRGLPWFLTGSTLPDDTLSTDFESGFLAHGLLFALAAIAILVGTYMTYIGDYPRGPRIVFGAGAFAALLIIIDFFSFRGAFSGYLEVGSSWGLWLGLLASLTAAVVGGMATAER